MIAATLAVAPAGCDTEPAPDRKLPEMREALILDGVAIQRADIEDFEGFLREVSPNTGRLTRLRYLLDRHLIPLAFARVQFAEERAKLREDAQGFAAALGASAGYDELVERAKRFSGTEIATNLTRTDVALPEQRWLFADENVGRVSPVLETPQGFSIVACSDKRPGVTTAFDRVDAVLVRFFSHKAKNHALWSQELKVRLGSLAPSEIKVHPDYADALPHWPKPVK